ncbi:DUF998 domain-containing protein [Myceligenerans pegani]|uniref:DUF998 domain-containing protein n=1 Tax=Myceligenerans pegani TaxID=2776917 RepID=A0ABR9MVK8_9MICO|nr:DUF998 domain-containing protein [Myceligenerans sp. TRM 65318]MBE1875431.1 DUF998 domain-containing protein [Myceligenerans sp. TRM 65318]MBE3017702.1 DUF998 domain-containing protein [Myceligenerans sp. TRM 65318]
MTSILRTGGAARLGALLLLAGPLVSWAAELVTAAAWTNPRYAPLYNWVSHLGLPEREIAFGQAADSPLAWVMNTGWVFHGVVLIAGAALLLDQRKGWRPIALTVLAVLSGVGVSLVGLVHGSNENVANGLAVFHFLGAQTVIVSGNVFALLAGLSAGRLGLGRSPGRTLVVLGVLGLIGYILFMVDVRAGIEWNIGLFERWAIYPIMIGHALLGAVTLTRQPATVLDKREAGAVLTG